ncbi:MAG TPA: NUDIX hydrolase [Cyclobacteriaceae bacterium]|jgi:8-oxo-dGTP diphosphatase
MVQFEESYHGKTRVRVCGLCLIENQLVLVRHCGLGETGTYWSPPGGGTNFQEPITEALKREFKEETNLEIEVRKYLFIHEFIGARLHAIEIFFDVFRTGGNLILGEDPEHRKDNQWLQEVKLFSQDELSDIPQNEKHQIFSMVSNFKDLLSLRGFFKSENNSIK